MLRVARHSVELVFRPDEVSSKRRSPRYRDSFDPKRGTPASWLVGIARRCIDDHLRAQGIEQPTEDNEIFDTPATPNMDDGIAVRLDLAAAVAALGPRDRELIALRYGADLKTKDIARLVGRSTNSIDDCASSCA